jgi:hypothetical protein
MKQRYYRLYFEIVFNRSTDSHGSVILAANSSDELASLASQLNHPESLCNENSTHCAAFPEACSVSVEMTLFINGKRDALVWGTLLSNVVGDHPHHLELKRLYSGRLTPVEVSLSDHNALRLPLLPGDHITWN